MDTLSQVQPGSTRLYDYHNQGTIHNQAQPYKAVGLNSG